MDKTDIQDTAEHAVKTLAPVIREIPADLDTPVSVFLKLAGAEPAFLLESVTGGEQVARYSFIGLNPRKAYLLEGEQFRIVENGRSRTCPLEADQNPLDFLRDEVGRYRLRDGAGLPRFAGGLVGFMSYDLIRRFEPTVPARRHQSIPDAIFLLADTVVAFDHAFGRILLIANVEENGTSEAVADAENKLDQLENQLSMSVPKPRTSRGGNAGAEMRSNMSRQAFLSAVEKAKEHIRAGDIFQVVLSQRFSRETHADPFSIYRALRRLNPSPYMFYFNFGNLVGEENLRLIGASPEMHVRLEGKNASVRPIAGTRPRGESREEDSSLEKALLQDPKERAEHVMLVDLARNDLGQVSEFGTVRVAEQMTVEKYSHVMHIVSHVEGRLRADQDMFDLMQATFPAGTVSGAPKIRAMQIIDELEGEPRGPYAGAVGYFSFDGSMDTCIAIRTLIMQGKQVSIQAGAGIVADSDPDREFVETQNKAKALAEAINLAEKQAPEKKLRAAGRMVTQ